MLIRGAADAAGCIKGLCIASLKGQEKPAIRCPLFSGAFPLNGSYYRMSHLREVMRFFASFRMMSSGEKSVP